jgi:hypothetical protein
LASVTLLVTPEQANMLDLGQNMGILTLSLRNPTDKADAFPEPATVARIQFRGEPPLANAMSTFLDGDLPPPASMLLTSVPVSTPAEMESKPTWIVTWRGGQRGRVLLTGENDARSSSQ